jgi:hypothetical protein
VVSGRFPARRNPTVEENFIYQGKAHGDLATTLLKHDFDPGVLRPFVGKRGLSYIEVNVRDRNGNLVWDNHKKAWAKKVVQSNAEASLRKDEWIQLGQAVRDIQYPQLRFFADLQSAVTPVRVDGMSQVLLRRQRMGDISGAQVGMSPLRHSERDMPEFDYYDVPLPIQYKHFFIDGRELRVSRRNGTGIDTIMARKMTRKVVEEIEDRATGVGASFSYGGGTLYGLTNQTNRNTTVLTLPTAVGWTPATLITEVLGMIQALQDDNYDGPYVLYYSRSWTQYFGDDYSAAKGDNTLWNRLEAIPDIGVGNVRRLNRLTGYQLVLVQMTEDVVQPIIGMEVMPVQYPNTDPFEFRMAVMGMKWVDVQSESNGNTGVNHGTAA